MIRWCPGVFSELFSGPDASMIDALMMDALASGCPGTPGISASPPARFGQALLFSTALGLAALHVLQHLTMRKTT
ncbi:hypothetical protein [Halomonas kalidii]|uniref:Uncharacterized protein n=1 Tax=Halomonas kalidii TaxID=3043293 RepID=A0ABT6VQ94_9GAMM|nr:hypothetical protein [Halomonas kalidii]MDI5935704.1 hypothetical protein [Halomonas kalidii]